MNEVSMSITPKPPTQPPKMLFLDTETTGLGRSNLVSLAYAVEGEAGVYESFFNPPTAINIAATMVHGITQERAKSFPRFDESADKEKLQNLLDSHILVTHNLSFDAGVLENEGLRISRGICNVKFSKRVLTEFDCHKLQWLRYTLCLGSNGVAHSAAGDVMVLRELFMYNCNRVLTDVNGNEKLKMMLENLIEHFNSSPE